ncbi:MAG: hypothetical protein ACI4XW_14175 [Candidatus Spyradocola sp.]
MTVSALNELFLMNMGYARSDAAEPDVVEEYAGVLLRWLNEGYARAVRRVLGRSALDSLDPLRAEEDEPVKLDEALHPCLADYAAARGQEVRGNHAQAGALYAAFERALAEASHAGEPAYAAWHSL